MNDDSLCPVFGERNMLVSSPISRPSNEPRFVIEGGGLTLLMHALEMFPFVLSEFWQGPGTFRWVSKQEQFLIVGHPFMGDSSFKNLERWTRLPKALTTDQMAEWILAWLDKADYPEPPFFQGSADPGFVAFCVDFGGEPHKFYGHMIVIPKIFELHK